MNKCYNCKFRGNLPGSAHSRCNVISSSGDDKSDTLEMLIVSGLYSITNKNTGEPIVKLNNYGVKNGWADWPINFDPVWVESCEFFNEG